MSITPWIKSAIKLYIVLIILFLLYFYGSRFVCSLNWKEHSDNYVKNKYDIDVELIDEGGTRYDKVFIYRTTDDNHIMFDVHCRVGGKGTPVGQMIFIPERHYFDNLCDRINEFVLSGRESVDMTGCETDDMVKYFSDMYDKLLVYYQKYGITGSYPAFTIQVTYEDRSANIRYFGQADEILRDTLVRELLLSDR